MVDDRKLDVLRAIVEDYVATEEPVGSKALVERHGLGVSPATVRNDMAVLEEEGLIAAPHTSAGRIPTDAGYRHYADAVAGERREGTPALHLERARAAAGAALDEALRSRGTATLGFVAGLVLSNGGGAALAAVWR